MAAPKSRGNIPNEHLDIIKHNYVYLIDELTPRYLLDHLLQAGVCDLDDVQTVRAAEEKDRAEAVRLLLKIVCSSGSEAFIKFKHCLRNSGYKYAVEKLESESVIPEHITQFYFLKSAVDYLDETFDYLIPRVVQVETDMEDGGHRIQTLEREMIEVKSDIESLKEVV
ncbi:hypothetical protein SNE40_006912 [Patella caerulea]|uniref:CARD domain-containing protein n=1 Tax=Patella caerulea TaxID=87958 RepID=A0AAN8PWS3_PATCE